MVDVALIVRNEKIEISGNGYDLVSPLVAQALSYANLAGHYANDTGNVDVPGGAAGSRGAAYWYGLAQAQAAAAGVSAGQAATSAALNRVVPLSTLNQMVYAIMGLATDGITRRMLYGIDSGLTHRFYSPVALPAETVTDAMLATAVRSRLPAPTGPQSGRIAYRAAYAPNGLDRVISDEIDTFGRVRGRIDAEALRYPAYVDGPTHSVYQHDDGAGGWQLRTVRHSDGQVLALTSEKVAVDPRFTRAGDFVSYSAPLNAAPKPKRRYRPVTGGRDYAYLPGFRICCLGDSLTFGAGSLGKQGYPEQMQAYIGYRWSITNDGIPSQRPDHIAARMGAIDTFITVAGNSVPAAGTVAVTACGTGPNLDRGSRIYPSGSGPLANMVNSSRLFTYAGQRFKLSTDAQNNYLLEQVGGVAPFAFPAGTAIRIDHLDFDDMLFVLWPFRNEAGTSPLDAEYCLNAIIAQIKSWERLFLVLGLTTQRNGTEDLNSTYYNSMVAFNARMLQLFPTLFIDIFKFLRGDAPYNDVTYPSGRTLGLAGAALSAQGQADLALGRIPIDFYSADNLHFNNAGYLAIARIVVFFIIMRGWNLP